MNPPPGSTAAVANEQFALYFPASSNIRTAIVLVETVDGSNVIGSYLLYIQQQLNTTIRLNTNVVDVVGYYSFFNTSLNPLAANFISPDNTSALVQIKYNKFSSQVDLGHFVSFLRDTADPLANENYTVGVTGQDVMFQDITDGSVSDMERMDIVVLPLALLTLAWVVRSYRLMIIPVCSVMISLLTGYLLMLPIAKNSLDCSSVCPSVMMSLTIAMSIDYSLFLLTRYREEHSRGKRNDIAVKNMEFFGGHIVAMSGGTLAITFLALAFFPMSFLQSVGIGASLALIVTMSVNLTLTPALLLTFGGFFSYFETPWLIKKLCPCCIKKESEYLDVGAAPPADNTVRMHSMKNGQPISPGATSINSINGVPVPGLEQSDSIYGKPGDAAKVKKQLASFWFKSAVCSTTPRFAILLIVVITAVCIPFIMEASTMETTIDTNQLIPRNSDGLAVYNQLMQHFPPGQISPYQLTLVTPSLFVPGGGGVYNSTFWYMTQSLIESLMIYAPGVSNASCSGITWFNGGPVPEAWAQACMNGQIPNNDDCYTYQDVWSQLTAENNNVTYISISVDFDPTGDQSPQFISDARDVIHNYSLIYPEYQYYLNGGAVNTYDAVNEVHLLFPWQVAGTCTLVFLIVGILFRSIFVPIRLLITIALPITWVYGFSVMVFQNGWFDSFSSNLNGIHALYWLIPVMCFSILVGLGLDYDIFLFSRVVEYRKLGYTDQAAIIKGIYHTGGIITAAGIIMFISFSGLMLSTEMALNQYGFMLAFAVLADTFIIRTLLVPAIMELAGPVNWWPGNMPPSTKDVMCQDEEVEDLSEETVEPAETTGLNQKLLGEFPAADEAYSYAVEE